MIKIGIYLREYVLDLNKEPKDEHELIVYSKGDDGNILPWGIEFVDDKSVQVEKYSDRLIIKTDYTELKNEVTISLRNYAKERLVVKIKPNMEALIPEVYSFEISDMKFENGEVSFGIISTVNDKGQPWRCTYLGYPLSYEFSQTEGKGSCRMHIKLLTELITEFKSKIIFEQEKSEKEIEMSLFNDKDGIKKAD